MTPAPIVVVGGGLAAGTLVTQLRERGLEGDIVLVTEEAHAPYERPPLSKDLLLGKAEPGDAAVHDDESWYADHGIDLRTATAATAIDTAQHRVQAGGEWLDYAELVLATGSRPRRLAMADQVAADQVAADAADGTDRDGGVPVHYLRTLDDALALRERLTPGARLGIVGGGWIGLEVASAARQHDTEVTLLEALELPLVRVLGHEVAEVFAGLHREHGVDLRTGVEVTSITAQGNGGTIALGDGAAVDVDALLVGIGILPNVELAETAGLLVDNGIRTDARLRTSDEHVHAIGDVANADHPVLGYPVRVEHWDTAIKHAKALAATLTGTPTEASDLPYFFTDQYDLGMEYVGHPGPDGYDRVVLTGDVPRRVFRAWWLRGDTVVAGMHVNDWDAIDEVRRVVGTSDGPPSA
jgi:3-phenylpropionate/trans-cinnamate dioxygenase ferredoxin reductase subunit